jgi:hypothetical protein
MGCASSQEDSVIRCQIDKQERVDVIKNKSQFLKDKTEEMKRKRKKSEHRRDLNRKVANLEVEENTNERESSAARENKIGVNKMFNADEIKMMLALEKGLLKP